MVQELHEGRWRPAVPVPFCGPLLLRCPKCGKRFWRYRRGVTWLTHVKYQRHYRAKHIAQAAS